MKQTRNCRTGQKAYSARWTATSIAIALLLTIVAQAYAADANATSADRLTNLNSNPATGPELLYGVPADDFLNTFPVLTIDPSTGGFSNFFNVTAPPPFNCSGGAVPMGSEFFYVSLPSGCQNQSPEIIGYSIDQSTGNLSALNGSPFSLPSSAIPQGMSTITKRNLLYVADLAGSIDVFSINGSTGVPTAIPGSPFKSGTNYDLTIDPSGKYLYAADYDPPGGVLAFSIGSGGALKPVPGSPFPVPSETANANFQPLGIVDTGKYIYIALITNQIAGFSIEPKTGALKPLPGLVPTGNGPGPLALTGNFLYTVNQLDATISGYTINSATGALTPVPGSPFGTDGVWLAIDFSGKYLYLSGGKGVQGYNIDPTTGSLTLGEGSHGNDGSLWLTMVQLPAQ